MFDLSIFLLCLGIGFVVVLSISRASGRFTSGVDRPRYSYPCPVCNLMYDKWTAPREHLRLSYDICPCCFNEFGYDDFSKTHEELRREWIEGGMKWTSDVEPPPSNWSPQQQLSMLYVSDRDFAAFNAAIESDEEPNDNLKALFINENASAGRS